MKTYAFIKMKSGEQPMKWKMIMTDRGMSDHIITKKNRKRKAK